MAPLLEREHELAMLDTLAADAAAGRSGLLVIEGPAGIGKTRLVGEGRRRASAAHVRVLGARGGELEQELAFGIVRQLFEATLGDAPLHGSAAGAREVFERPANDVAGEDASFAILHALFWLTVNLAEDAPLLLAVDDLQWCDEPSLRYLGYLVRRLDGLPVTVLGGVRPFERHAHAHLLAEIAGDPLAATLRPRPLSEGATAALLQADEGFAHACHAATGGNPLLVGELVKALRAEGVAPETRNAGAIEALAPRAASSAVLVRLARLSTAAVAVARATAVLGDDAELTVVAALAGVDDERAVAAAGELVGAEIMADQTAMAFVHPLIRAAVYEDIPAVERSLAHERAARVLRDRGAQAESIAAQLWRAPARGDPWVVEVLERAARSAQRAGAPASAAAHLRRALAEPPHDARRAQVLLALSDAEKVLHAPTAIEYMRQAIELLDDPLARGAASLSLARALTLSRQVDDGTALARSAAAELPPAAGALHAAFEAVELIAPLFGGDEPAPERYARHRGLPLAPGLGPKSLAAIAAHQWAYSGGSAQECAPLALAALAGGELIERGSIMLSVVATMVVALADRDEALATWDALLANAHARGSLTSKASTSLFGGYTLYRRAELTEAEASLRAAVEEIVLWNAGGEGRVHAAAWLAAVLRERGDIAGARAALDAAAEPGDTSDAARCWLDSHAEQLLAEEEFERALAVAEAAERRFAALAAIDTPAASHQAVALHHLGRHADAVARAERQLAIARRWGAPSIVARALRVLGTVARPRGLVHLHEAVELAAASPARLELAKALAAEGAALRAARRPTEAREPLRQALELAEALGAELLFKQARYELHAAGGRIRTTALQGPDALTPSERRVAARAAAGQTNRAIAEALFVTPKTVELHLRNAYRKLGARGRNDLAALLGETAAALVGQG